MCAASTGSRRAVAARRRRRPEAKTTRRSSPSAAVSSSSELCTAACSCASSSGPQATVAERLAAWGADAGWAQGPGSFATEPFHPTSEKACENPRYAPVNTASRKINAPNPRPPYKILRKKILQNICKIFASLQIFAKFSKDREGSLQKWAQTVRDYKYYIPLKRSDVLLKQKFCKNFAAEKSIFKFN